ncbi:MAG: hypothetical protein H7Z41_10495 [Cytophagales bacterium]|nr:hypothetical protein [Armatimonadota bacterium]
MDGLFDTLFRDSIRQSLLAEVAVAAGRLAVTAVALLIASWMPLGVRGAIAVAAVIVIPLYLMRKIGAG